MILHEDWKAINIPTFPRTFKWKFKNFKKAMVSKKLKRTLSNDDRIVKSSMEGMHGGIYWPTTDGGLIALPYDSKKFDFKEWVE